MKASNRRRIDHALAAGFAFLVITLGNAAAVQADTIASFQSGGTSDYSYTAGTTSTLNSTTNLGGSVTFGIAFFNPSPDGTGPYGATINLTASSSTAASGSQQGGFSGSYTITNGPQKGTSPPIPGIAAGATLLTVSFTGATLTDNGGGSYTLGGSAAILVGSAFVSAGASAISSPESFSLGLATTSDHGFNSFTAGDVNTTAATIGVPEPSSMAIAGIGALGMIGYGLRRRKALGA